MSLHGGAMRGTVVHEGVHLVQQHRLASTYDGATGRYSASANMTKMQQEHEAFVVANKTFHEFDSDSAIDKFIRQHYDDLDHRMLFPWFVQ
jgi:hypothetical protein